MMENIILDDMSDHRVCHGARNVSRFYIVKNRFIDYNVYLYGTLKIDTYLRYNKFCPFSQAIVRSSKTIKRETRLYTDTEHIQRLDFAKSDVRQFCF